MRTFFFRLRNLQNLNIFGARRMVLLTCLLTAMLVFLAVSQTNQLAVQRKALSEAFLTKVPPHDTFHPNDFGVCSGRRWPAGQVPLYIITPTYPRAEQISELTRIGQTLLLVESLVWIVAEDSSKPSETVKQFLEESGHCYVYLHAPMPSKYLKLKTKPRGVANRNAGLSWIRKNAKTGGVAYFADDDNTYDRRLFEEIRTTKKVSMFPVGFVTKLGVSSPIVRGGKVVDFYDGWLAKRKFPVDMAGFAFNVDYFLSLPQDVAMPFKAGHEETKFLEQLKIKKEDIEPLADGCSKIMVWHTRTQKNKPPADSPTINIADSNIVRLKQSLWKGTR